MYGSFRSANRKVPFLKRWELQNIALRNATYPYAYNFLAGASQLSSVNNRNMRLMTVSWFSFSDLKTQPEIRIFQNQINRHETASFKS
jgi:hypothetical protein